LRNFAVLLNGVLALAWMLWRAVVHNHNLVEQIIELPDPTEKAVRMTYSFGANTSIQRIIITTTSGTQF
jgi:hypothetical protein